MQLDPQQTAQLQRAQRLRSLRHSEGWNDLVRISEAIGNEALQALHEYGGTDEKHMAALAMSWKTLLAHHAKLVATVDTMIVQGNELVRPRTEPTEDEEFQGIMPQCVADGRGGQ